MGRTSHQALITEVFGDPHVVHTGLVQEMPHHTARSVKFVGPPVRYSKAENRARLPPPTLGEHTQQVLQETLGYSQEKIQQLRAVKAIQ